MIANKKGGNKMDYQEMFNEVVNSPNYDGDYTEDDYDYVKSMYGKDYIHDLYGEMQMMEEL